MAELLRRHPELIDFQEDLKYQVFAISIDCEPSSLDVRTELQVAKVPFPFERLLSSDPNESARYRECRALADDANESTGIAYPCVALFVDDRWNAALFGNAGQRWTSDGFVEVERPIIDTAEVRRIEPGN